MIGIIAYGSLIHPLEQTSQKGVVNAIPVKVKGFKRLFDQRASWRKGEGDRLAVLNVEISSVHAINAICLCFESQEREALRERERGYHEKNVSRSQIECYEGYRLPDLAELYIYIGKDNRKAKDIMPNDAYLDLCMMGAHEWGVEFCRDFMSTTYIADGTQLHGYIAAQRHELTHLCPLTP